MWLAYFCLVALAVLVDLFAATTDIFNDVHECRQFERFVHEPIHTYVTV